jgi:hypothetical protein
MHERIKEGVRAASMTNNPNKLSRWSAAEIDWQQIYWTSKKGESP